MNNYKKEKRSAKVPTSKEFVLGKGQERSSRTPTLGLFLFSSPQGAPWASIDMLDSPNIPQMDKQINYFLAENLPFLPDFAASLGTAWHRAGLALVHREPRPPYSSVWGSPFEAWRGRLLDPTPRRVFLMIGK